MALPYSAYQKKIKPFLKQLSDEQLLFTGTWIAEYLDAQYGSYLDKINHPAERQVLQNAIIFLWNTIDSQITPDETVLKKQLKQVRNIDIDNLDFARPDDCGILKLMEATESMLCFVKDKNPERILETAWYPLDILSTIKDAAIPKYETPPGYTIDDPFFSKELAAQLQLFDYLDQQGKAGSDDKLIFRQ